MFKFWKKEVQKTRLQLMEEREEQEAQEAQEAKKEQERKIKEKEEKKENAKKIELPYNMIEIKLNNGYIIIIPYLFRRLRYESNRYDFTGHKCQISESLY